MWRLLSFYVADYLAYLSAVPAPAKSISCDDRVELEFLVFVHDWFKNHVSLRATQNRHLVAILGLMEFTIDGSAVNNDRGNVGGYLIDCLASPLGQIMGMLTPDMVYPVTSIGAEVTASTQVNVSGRQRDSL